MNLRPSLLGVATISLVWPQPSPRPAVVPCGNARPALEEIRSAEGLVISPGGTIYFTQPLGADGSSYLGRYRPPYKQVETTWLEIGAHPRGITLDPKRKVLYVGSRARKKLLAVALEDPPVVRGLADVEAGINGVTLGEDSAVYYTDKGGGHVYRVLADGTKTRVTSTPLDAPSGLAFGPDGGLYVLMHRRARIMRLELLQGKEIARSLFAEIAGGRNADGIAFDARGRLYVTAGALYRLGVDGHKIVRVADAYGASAEFGRGALGCSDLYTAGNGRGITRVAVDGPGLDVPWHRDAIPLVPPPAPPPQVPANLAAKVKLELVTRDTTEAVGIVAAPGEPVGRLFVVEKRGSIRLLREKAFNPEPFLDLTGHVSLWNEANGEQGLLGLAFHPRFETNGRFFVNYTDPRGDTRIVEQRVDRSDPDRADPSWSREILFVHQPYRNHNGGNLEFGPDGKLYVLLGDGGSSGDPHGNAQDPSTLLGKMLRIDVDAAAPEPVVLGRGLRNPWRYSFDRGTGDLYIADVGQNTFEYVHHVAAARIAGPHNFGWNVTEGKHCYAAALCTVAGLDEPVVEYSHSEGCSITGGYVYRGKALPALLGAYFFSDQCTAILRSFRIENGRAIDAWDWKAALDPEFRLASVVAFGEDQDGELYLVTHEGPIYRFVAADTARARLRP